MTLCGSLGKMYSWLLSLIWLTVLDVFIGAVSYRFIQLLENYNKIAISIWDIGVFQRCSFTYCIQNDSFQNKQLNSPVRIDTRTIERQRGAVFCRLFWTSNIHLFLLLFLHCKMYFNIFRSFRFCAVLILFLPTMVRISLVSVLRGRPTGRITHLLFDCLWIFSQDVSYFRFSEECLVLMWLRTYASHYFFHRSLTYP